MCLTHSGSGGVKPRPCRRSPGSVVPLAVMMSSPALVARQGNAPGDSRSPRRIGNLDVTAVMAAMHHRPDTGGGEGGAVSTWARKPMVGPFAVAGMVSHRCVQARTLRVIVATVFQLVCFT